VIGLLIIGRGELGGVGWIKIGKIGFHLGKNVVYILPIGFV
jgi:hypothetical protein